MTVFSEISSLSDFVELVLNGVRFYGQKKKEIA
jgi:hypothetical protein